MQRNDLFYKIINNENLFTELLCNLLNFEQNKILSGNKFKEIFFDFLKIKEPEKYECDTQFRTDNNGNPDLIISSDDEIYLIEIKINDAELTKNQPKGYLKEIEEDEEHKKNIYILLSQENIHMNLNLERE